MKTANFDGLATFYRALEYIVFGRDLERARFCLLDRLAGCRSILILGEGDGRCLERLVRIAPQARIHCLDASGAMLAKARARIAGTEAAPRVTFQQADARDVTLPDSVYDAVVTLFFLDCFTHPQLNLLVPRIAHSLRPQAHWLFADFALPPRGLPRLRARVWLAVLYWFFRWRTGLAARALPPSEPQIESAGFRVAAERSRQQGLLRSVGFERQ